MLIKKGYKQVVKSKHFRIQPVARISCQTSQIARDFVWA